MPITKETIAFLPSQILAAAASKDGDWIDLRARYGCTVVAVITNGGTGPDEPPDFVVDYSHDAGVTSAEAIRIPGNTGNNAVSVLRHRIEPEILFARAGFENNNGQSVTVRADGHLVKTVG